MAKRKKDVAKQDSSFNQDELSRLGDLFKEVDEQRFVSTKPKLIREMIPIEQWLNDPYYIGPDGAKLYPYWKNMLCELFKVDSPYTEVILAGSIGTGKSTVALYGFVRKLYEMSCYENIAGLYSLMKTSSISFIYLSLNLKQALGTGFGQITNILDSIPYFQEIFSRDLKISSELKFPEHVHLKAGSTGNHIIGTNLIGAILDEANFHQGEAKSANNLTEVSKVEDLYTSILARGRSRFLYGGKNHSLSFLVSSSTCKGSMTERRLEIAKSENFAHTLYANPKLWDVKGDRYSSERFYVFTGSDKLDPFIIESKNDIKTLCGALNVEVPKMPFKESCELLLQIPDDMVVSVPIDFKDDFVSDLMKSIQDLAGVSTSPTGRLFTSHPLYNMCVGKALQHPFTKDIVPLSTGDNVRLEDWLKHDFEFVDPHKPHYLHLDYAIKGDDLGIAMSHIDSFIEDDTGARLPLFVVDMQLRVSPPKAPNEIPLARVRQFIVYLRDFLNINIYGVSFDQAHSSESMQLLRDAGFDVQYRSVDRKDDAYLNFCSLIYDRRIIDYKYQPFEDEFFNLVHYRDKHKVDHLPGFKKDVSDAKVGSIQGLIDNLMNIPVDLEGVEHAVVSEHEDDIEDLFTIEDLLEGTDLWDI